MALITKGSVNESSTLPEKKDPKEVLPPSHGREGEKQPEVVVLDIPGVEVTEDGVIVLPSNEKDDMDVKLLNPSPESNYIDNLYETGWISEEEHRYLQYLLATSVHVPESERVVIMGILEERLSYYRNTRNIYCPRYQWMQDNLVTLDLYLEQNGLGWSDKLKQHVLSEYYDTYVRDDVPIFLTAGAASVLEGEILDWEKCQDIYDGISINYIDITIERPIWYGNPMQLNGNSDQEKYLSERIRDLKISWSQEKVDQLWEACEQIYDEYGVGIDPRFLLAIIIQEGTGSFNTSGTNLAADGGHGVEEEFTQDLKNASELIFGKTLGYIYYNAQFVETANNNSDLLDNSTGNIFTYYNWETPIIDLGNGCVRTGVYAANYNWATGVEQIYESLTYDGAGEDYNDYILGMDPSIVEDITQWGELPDFTFSAKENGVDYQGKLCGAYTIIAEEIE